MQEAEAHIEDINRQAEAIAKVLSEKAFDASSNNESRARNNAHQMGSNMVKDMDSLEWPKG